MSTVYQIQNIDTRKVCQIDLVSQKIGLLNMKTIAASLYSYDLRQHSVHQSSLYYIWNR